LDVINNTEMSEVLRSLIQVTYHVWSRQEKRAAHGKLAEPFDEPFRYGCLKVVSVDEMK
jgi:hypothetical protein